ncbi:MAG: hypothetical protein KQH59_19700 [Desulfobulbaceae bacterium]|nr:hypothetical protein [Desulfobulbaceae bacterium]
MKQLLGFAVLTGPLFLILLWVPVCLAVAFLVGKKVIKKSLILKITGGLAIFLIMLLLPVSDEIAGRVYLNHLCETEAGVKVYQTIELPTEYWDEDGNPLFMNSRGVLDMEMLGDRFEWRTQDIPYVKNFVKIINLKWMLYDKETQKIIGEKNSFLRHYGWINMFSPAPNIGEGCRDLLATNQNKDIFEAHQISIEKKFILQMFSPSTAQDRGEK